MARDYRHGHARRAGFQRKSQQDGSAQESGVNLSSGQMLWLGGVAITVLLVAAFFVIKHFASQGVKASETRNNEIYQLEATPTEQAVPPGLVVEAPKVEQSETPVAEVEESLTSRFSFYHDLALTEVVVDAEPLPIELPEPMWIQAGSFSEPEQAAREQARLLRGGHEVVVSPIDTVDGRYYRIMSGPYTDRLIMNQVRNSLRRLGADTRVVRIKTEPQTPAN